MLLGTIVANSTTGIGNEIRGVIIDSGDNIVEDGSGLSDPTSMSGDPNLGPLVDNGGPTLTQALLPGSIAIDAASCAKNTPSQDQRGIARPQGSSCDIGSFELIPR